MASFLPNLQNQWKTGFQMLKDFLYGLGRSFDSEESQELEKRAFYDELLRTLQNARNELKVKNETVKTLESQISELMSISKELMSTKKLVETFDQKIKEKDREIVLLKENNSDLSAKLEKAKRAKNDLQREKENTYRKLEDYVDTINRNEKSIEDLEKELGKIKRAFQEKNEELKARERKNEDFTSKFRQEKDDLLSEIAKKDRVNKELAAKIEDLNQIYDLYQETKQKNERLLLEREETESNMCHMRLIFEQEKAKLIDENEEILHDLAKRKENTSENERLIEDLLLKDRRLEEKCNEIQREIKEKNLKIEDKNQKLKTLSLELRNMNEKVIDLSKLSDRLISENETLKKNLNELLKKDELYKLKQENITKMKMNNASKRNEELEKLSNTMEKLYSANIPKKK